jgi:hypothetical protein
MMRPYLETDIVTARRKSRYYQFGSKSKEIRSVQSSKVELEER